MSTLLDQESVVLEALDFEPPCADEVEPPHAAEVAITCQACGGVLLLCESHFAYARWKFARGVKHTTCGATRRTFDALFTWRPLS